MASHNGPPPQDPESLDRGVLVASYLGEVSVEDLELVGRSSWPNVIGLAEHNAELMAEACSGTRSVGGLAVGIWNSQIS
ncbi:hypothetical protein R1flu_013756 [Riccia fluitans]|uniref:Uncharacterized protein n=1 Tax=Riccia fluitans TaxID=41844 RepID=A0ABD1YEI1_9MARC